MENTTYIKSTKANVSTAERIASIAVGALIIYIGIKKKNILLLIPAAAISYHGLSGCCQLGDMMGKKSIKNHNVNIRMNLVIKKPVAEVYDFWRKLENLPLFMTHLDTVTQTNKTTSHWIAKIKGIGTIEWDATIVNEVKNEVLGWKSTSHDVIDHAGKITFESIGPYTTVVDVVFSYRAPLGAIGAPIARLLTPAMEKIIRKDIKNFADYIENGFQQNQLSDFRNELI